MGVKTALTLDQANQLFKAYDFEQIRPTMNGIIDTTYIVENSTASYIMPNRSKRSVVFSKNLHTVRSMFRNISLQLKIGISIPVYPAKWSARSLMFTCRH
jgi:hypothetical protein